MSEEKPSTKQNTRARILIVDDHPVLREGLSGLIDREPDMLVCGQVETAEEAIEAVASLSPTLVIVDLSLTGKPGLELIKDLHAHHPEVLVLVLSMHDESLWAERVLRAGACGYVMKQENPRTIIDRIRQALRGETSLSAPMTGTLLRKLRTGRNTHPNAEDDLGDRELAVLQLIGQGRGTRDIAASLHISVKTVEAHREHIKRKLNLGSGDELLRYAVMRFMGK